MQVQHTYEYDFISIINDFIYFSNQACENE